MDKERNYTMEKNNKKNTENNMNASVDERIKARTGMFKKILVGVIALTVGIASYCVYDNFFNYEEVDLFADKPEVATEGYDGVGIVTYDTQQAYADGTYVLDDEDSDYSDYDSESTSKEAQARRDFADTVTYSFNDTANFSNGDKVVITADYDEDLAKEAKIKVKEDSKTYKVSGLMERFKKDGSDISDKQMKLIKKYCSDYAAEEVEDDQTVFGKLEEFDFVSRKEGCTATSLFQVDCTPYYNDAILAVFSYSVPNFPEEEGRHRYGYMYIEGVNRSTDFKKLGEVSQHSDPLYGQNIGINIGFGNYRSMDDVQKAIKENFEGEKITKL